jgi:uncharacterized protein (TIGR02266 family)
VTSERPRRRYRRRTVRVLVDYATASGPHCDLATTLGAGGLFIESDDPPREGSMLKLRFRLPGSEAVHEIEGRVVWTRRPRAGDAHAAGMGIEFSDPLASAKLAQELKLLD